MKSCLLALSQYSLFFGDPQTLLNRLLYQTDPCVIKHVSVGNPCLIRRKYYMC